MSTGFRAVQWNRQKIVYDAVLVAGVAAYVTGFVLVAWHWHPPGGSADTIDIFIRALGTCAFLMLTIILCIGPLARLSARFLPLLYNRRHFGVLTFLIALVHAWLMIEWFMVQDSLPDLANEMTAMADYGKFIGFPFKALGLAALIVLFVMAATSHDFWLAFLTPPIWKALHMLLYVAYGLVVMHVALGIMLYERTPLIPLMLIAGFGCVATLHLVAGLRERANDRGTQLTADGWIVVGPPRSIPDKAARIVSAPAGERIAVFRDNGEIGALTNLCAHQNGPLGEGRIIDGCVTCPWHGYQYRLADGRAPPPFTEKLATFRVRLRDGVVEVDPRPLAPGTPAAIACPRELL
jgi:nitrite reductase/ring-hydroxylating ferredoxin subunit/DMSO/TMAO reductase YedYZ heme-binding membrane subunit